MLYALFNDIPAHIMYSLGYNTTLFIFDSEQREWWVTRRCDSKLTTASTLQKWTSGANDESLLCIKQRHTRGDSLPLDLWQSLYLGVNRLWTSFTIVGITINISHVYAIFRNERHCVTVDKRQQLHATLSRNDVDIPQELTKFPNHWTYLKNVSA